MTGPTAPATSISQAARSARGTAVAAIISWAGTDDCGDLSPPEPIPPPAARGRAAADPAATAGFIGRWWSLEHSKSPMIQLKNHRQKCE
jgi:hypothetical protein